MHRIAKIIVWFIMLLPLAYLAAIWTSLPAQVPVHFNLTGKADRFGSKNELLSVSFLLTGVNAFVYLLLTNVYRLDPKRNAIENRMRLSRIAFAVSVFLAGLLCFILYSSKHVDSKFAPRLIFSSVGLLFALIGNYMHTIRPNYFAGFRLPWTLENEENWRKTHLLAGKLWFWAGLLIAVACLVLPTIVSLVLFFTIVVTITIIPAIYSYRLFKQQKNIQTPAP
jgi:uncharacterized membrane protein